MTSQNRRHVGILAIKIPTALAIAWLMLPTTKALANIEISGVKIDNTANVGGSTLVLNGAGIRYRTVFKVYVAALYVTKRVSTSEEFYSLPGPKRFVLTLQRDIDSNDFGRSFTKGFSDNASKSDLVKHIPGLTRMGQIFSEQKKLVSGDTIVVDWIPGTGMVITTKGQIRGTASKEIEFFNGFMSIWLGPNPPDWMIKNGLLGKSS